MSHELTANSAHQIDWSHELLRHRSWLCSVLLSRSRDPQAVEDLWQELAVVVLRQGHQLKDANRVAPWLYKIAVRQALMYRRMLGRQRRQRQAQFDRAQSDSTANHYDPLNWLLRDERASLIREAIATLPSRDAELLVLKYSEDWSYRELAEHIGTTESTIDSRLFRARQKLRTALSRRNIAGVNK